MPTPTIFICKPRLPAQFTTQRDALLGELADQPGLAFVHLPVFELGPLPGMLGKVQEWIGQRSPERPSLIVCVSPSALEMLIGQLGQWPAGVLCGVMGHQSAQLAQKLGVAQELLLAPTGDSPEESEDSDGLLHLLKARFPKQPLDVLVCKGPRGRAQFPQALAEMGCKVEVLECYSREPIVHDAQALAPILNAQDGAVLWLTSSETVQALDSNLLQALGQQACQQIRSRAVVLTTHPRIEAKCQELGYQIVHRIPTGIQSVKTWLNDHKNNMDKPTQTENVAAPTAAPSSPSQGPRYSAAPPVAPSNQGQPWLAKLAFFVAVFALVITLLAAFAAKTQIDKTRIAFGERIQKESTTVELIKDQVVTSSDLSKDLRTRFEILEQAQKEEASQRAALQDVYNSLLASRTEVSISEVQQLISIARRQLYLLGNVSGASIALSQAIELLETTDKPALLNLRSALQGDLAEVQALPKEDLLRQAIVLDGVINSIDAMPTMAAADAKNDTNLAELTEDAPLEEPASSAELEPAALTPQPTEGQSTTPYLDQGLAWVQAFAAQSWREIKSLIEVSKVESPEILLLSAQQELDLKNALRLSLLNARLSLLSRHADLLKSDLARSRMILETYFDPKSPQVQRALATVTELDQLQLNLVLPELKATTSALRLAMAGQRGEQP